MLRYKNPNKFKNIKSDSSYITPRVDFSGSVTEMHVFAFLRKKIM